jgi:uncharacterized membrane protein
MVSGRQKKKLHRTPEGRILWAGILMSVLLAGVIGYIGKIDLQTAQTLILVLIAHTFGGRAAGISLCIMGNVNQVWTIIYNFYLEILIVCFTYSAFVLSVHHYITSRPVRLFFIRLERNARRQKHKIENYGWLGLFVFVMAPLPVTGPVIGSMIGYLLRMPLWRNFTAIFLGTLTAIILWTLSFDFLDAHIHAIKYIFAGIIAVVVLSYLKTVREWLEK